MKQLFVTIAFLLAAGASQAVQEVPARQVSFPTSAVYYAIQPTSDVAQAAIEDLDAESSNLNVRVTANEANIATNTANIATNTINIATNTINIATNTINIATNTLNIASNTALLGSVVYTSAWNICTASTTINVSNAMSLDDIYAAGSTYDYLENGVVLTYLFATGTYTFAETFRMNRMTVCGQGSVVIRGTYTSTNSPETIIYCTSNAVAVASVGSISTGTSGDAVQNCPVLVTGFTFRGPGTGSASFGVASSGHGAILTLRSPIRVENTAASGIHAALGGTVYVQPHLDDLTPTPMYIDAPAGVGGSLRGVIAYDEGYLLVSTTPADPNFTVFVYSGGASSFYDLLAAERNSTVNMSTHSIGTVAATTGSSADVTVNYNSLIMLQNYGSLTTNVTFGGVLASY